jgi:hypothetical protein
MSATTDGQSTFSAPFRPSSALTSTDTSSLPASTSGSAASSTDVSTISQMSSSSPTESVALPTTTSAAVCDSGLRKRLLWTGLLVLVACLA